MKTQFFLLLAVSITLLSCEKEELPVEPYDRGPAIASQVDMGSGYINQIYFSLDNNEIAGSQFFSDWDVAFEGGSEGWKVILNDARLMSAWKSDFGDIASANDSSGFGNGKRVEVMATIYSDPAMGDWRDETPVYLLDLGYSVAGQPLGLYWIQILSVDGINYQIKTRAFGKEAITEATVQKQEGVLYTHYSIAENNSIPSPADQDWDIQFTKYTYRFIDPAQDYLVTGLVLNPNNTFAGELSEKAFADITLADTAQVEFSNQPDIIGYDWKYYDFNSSSYEIDSERVWVIRNASGFYYKFRFIDFYDEQGQVGVPGFEYGKI